MDCGVPVGCWAHGLWGSPVGFGAPTGWCLRGYASLGLCGHLCLRVQLTWSWAFIDSFLTYSPGLTDEEEGEDGDPSLGLPGPCHKLPPAPAWHHFPPRCVDVGCAGLRDAHEENPESILDEHVQRVLRTPGRQSPGPGHRSPDSGHMAKMPVVLGSAASGHGKHVPKSGVKLDAAGLHHHRHVHHHVHHSTSPAQGAGGGRGCPQGAEQLHVGSGTTQPWGKVPRLLRECGRCPQRQRWPGPQWEGGHGMQKKCQEGRVREERQR
ncbi:hypothetical protein H8959_009965 [Pygathrix nigripes]